MPHDAVSGDETTLPPAPSAPFNWPALPHQVRMMAWPDGH